MKNKKKLFLLIIILLLTGCDCSVKYNATINEKNINESVTFMTNLSTDEIEALDYYKIPIDKYYQDKNYDPYDILSYQNGVTYYNKRIENSDVIYSQSFGVNEYYNSNMLAKLFNNFDSKYDIKTNDFVINSGSIDFYPNDISSITLNYKIDGKVVSNNADYVNDNIYTWVITKDNYKNKIVLLDINFNASTGFNIFLLIFIIVAFLLILIIYIFISIRSKKNNKI